MLNLAWHNVIIWKSDIVNLHKRLRHIIQVFICHCIQNEIINGKRRTTYIRISQQIRVMGCRGDPAGQDGKIVGETVHARGDDGWRWEGRPYGWQWNVNERTLG
jgi:hypothetical protein